MHNAPFTLASAPPRFDEGRRASPPQAQQMAVWIRRCAAGCCRSSPSAFCSRTTPHLPFSSPWSLACTIFPAPHPHALSAAARPLAHPYPCSRFLLLLARLPVSQLFPSTDHVCRAALHLTSPSIHDRLRACGRVAQSDISGGRLAFTRLPLPIPSSPLAKTGERLHFDEPLSERLLA